MNFYEHQDLARKQTKRLLILFVIALGGLILLTAYVVAGIGYTIGLHNARFESYQTGQSIWSISSQVFDWQYLGLIALGVLSVVFIASLFRMVQLSAGGKVIAEQLGGRLINVNPRDALEKRLLNVVEEMAIASGTSVPSVYVMDELGINAFAAGFQSADAVIGVTRGAIESLDREELQGVIAHEFSHILNGDMRLNLRLIGMIYGIIVIANTGRYLMYSRGSSNRDRGKTLSIGIALMLLGYLGIFFGNLIKAAISRQREFLADASAVQYTRSKSGISGALKKIGGLSSISSSRQEWKAKDVNEISHMLFSQGLHFSFFNKLMATHPPLQERIKRIDSNWDGDFVVPEREPERVPERVPETERGNPSASKSSLADVEGASALTTNADLLAGVAGMAASATARSASLNGSGALNITDLTVDDLIHAIDHSGDPSDAVITKASSDLNRLKAEFELLCEKIHEPYTARGLVFAMLLDSKSSIRQQQWENIEKHQSQELLKQTRFVYDQLQLLKPTQPMILLDLALPILKALSDAQYKEFKIQLLRLIKIDKKIEIREWALYHLVDQHCRPRKLIHLHSVSLKQRKSAIARLLSALANISLIHKKQDTEMAKKIFDIVVISEFDFSLRWYSRNELTTESLTQSLHQVRHLKPLQKPQLLKACVKIIQHDGIIESRELELITCIAQAIDCPLPYMDLGSCPKID